MINDLKELWRFRELLWALIFRELRIRYKNSALGFFWSLLNPLATAIVLTIVFKFFLRVRIDNYSAYVFAAYFPWVFFQMALLDSAQSVVNYMPLIKKIYFPREILPLGYVLANFFHFLLSMVVFFVYLLGIWAFVPGHQLPLTGMAVFAPLVIIMQLLLITGLSFIISAMNAFYEDIKYITAVGLQILFYLTPVVYFSGHTREAMLFGGKYSEWIYWIYHLNPMATIVTLYRRLLLPSANLTLDSGKVIESSPIEPAMVVICLAVSVLVAVLGYAYFNKMKWRFAERA